MLRPVQGEEKYSYTKNEEITRLHWRCLYGTKVEKYRNSQHAAVINTSVRVRKRLRNTILWKCGTMSHSLLQNE